MKKAWLADIDRLRMAISTAINSIIDTTSCESTQIRDKLKAIHLTATEIEIHKAIGKSNANI